MFINTGNQNIQSGEHNRFNKVSFQWSTQTEVPGEYDSIEGGQLGLVHYPTFANRLRRIDFYIPANMRITTAELHYKFFDQLWVGTTTRLNGLYTRLNPTKATLDQSGSNTWQFSSGTVFRSNFAPTADEDTLTDVLTKDQIQAINYGWNTIVIQQETEDVDEDNLGHLVASLIINGFTPLSSNVAWS